MCRGISLIALVFGRALAANVTLPGVNVTLPGVNVTPPVVTEPAVPVVTEPAVPTAPAPLPPATMPATHEGDVDWYNGVGYQCMNVSETNRWHFNTSNKNMHTCYGNLLWAMDTGIKKQEAGEYNPPCYPGLTAESSMYEFQFALFQDNSPNNSCASWGCPMPCGMAEKSLAMSLNPVVVETVAPTPLPAVPTPAPVITPPPTLSPTVKAAPPPGFPWWGWALIGLVGFCCIAAIAAFFFNQHKGAQSKKPQKKKRAVAHNTSAAPAETRPLVAHTPAHVPSSQVRTMAVTPTAVATTAVPISTAAPIPSYTPVAQPVTTAIPTVAVQAAPASISYAAPAMTYTPVAPAYGVVAPRAQTAMELFDELDVNKDGQVSREEFARIAQMRGIPM